MRNSLITSFLFVMLYSCNNKDNKIKPSNDTIQHNLIIDIQPFNNVSDKQVQNLYKNLKSIYPFIHVNKAISLPSSAYYAKRNRYRADSLISYLKKRTPTGHVTIGMTNMDISTTKGNIIDYGIMGLGYQPGRSCVVSTFRLNKKNLDEQFFKLSIHELGHTQGLKHCEVLTCFMRDAKGKNHTDEEKEFCIECRKHLSNKGWVFLN